MFISPTQGWNLPLLGSLIFRHGVPRRWWLDVPHTNCRQVWWDKIQVRNHRHVWIIEQCSIASLCDWFNPNLVACIFPRFKQVACFTTLCRKALWSGISLVLLFFALRLVQKTQPSLSINKNVTMMSWSFIYSLPSGRLLVEHGHWCFSFLLFYWYTGSMLLKLCVAWNSYMVEESFTGTNFFADISIIYNISPFTET